MQNHSFYASDQASVEVEIEYRKVPKFSDARKRRCNLPIYNSNKEAKP